MHTLHSNHMEEGGEFSLESCFSPKTTSPRSSVPHFFWPGPVSSTLLPHEHTKKSERASFRLIELAGRSGTVGVWCSTLRYSTIWLCTWMLIHESWLSVINVDQVPSMSDTLEQSAEEMWNCSQWQHKTCDEKKHNQKTCKTAAAHSHPSWMFLACNIMIRSKEINCPMFDSWGPTIIM